MVRPFIDRQASLPCGPIGRGQCDCDHQGEVAKSYEKIAVASGPLPVHGSPGTPPQTH